MAVDVVYPVHVPCTLSMFRVRWPHYRPAVTGEALVVLRLPDAAPHALREVEAVGYRVMYPSLEPEDGARVSEPVAGSLEGLKLIGEGYSLPSYC